MTAALLALTAWTTRIVTRQPFTILITLAWMVTVAIYVVNGVTPW